MVVVRLPPTLDLMEHYAMKQILAALVFGACVAAHGGEVAISDEFIRLLQKNASEKRMGANDPQKFFATLTELANHADPAAQFLLGLTVLKERRDLAEEYLKASAHSGCAGAEMGVGLLAMLRKQWATGIAHFKVAAAAGDATAQVALSGLHERGEHGLDRSLPKAYAWLRVAERQTFSSGGRLAIRDGMKKLKSGMSDQDVAESEKEFSELSGANPRVNYYFCGQFNIDASLDPNVAEYYKF